MGPAAPGQRRSGGARAAAAPPVADAGAAAKWRSILSAGSTLGEAESLALLADFDVPTTAARFGNSLYAVNARFSTPPTPTTEYQVVRVTR